MRLPDGAHAHVDHEKIDGYLLSRTHPTGRFKARFFRSIGLDDAADLESALLVVARNGTVTSRMRTEYGMKYIVDGRLPTPTGTPVPVRTVWLRERRAPEPRFVTAYPL
ncbi:MAG: DUF6883 domain-containing protein [Gemmatimonadota bacterium]